MPTNPTKQISQRQQVRSIQERLDTLEMDLSNLVPAINSAFSRQNNTSNDLAEDIEAIKEMLGVEAVAAQRESIMRRKQLEALEKAKKALADGIEKGELEKAGIIGEGDVIVGRQTTADGKEVFPGRVQVVFGSLKPEFKKALLGASVGAAVDVGDGGKFEVLEVYRPVTKSEPPQVAPVVGDEG